MTQEEKLKEIQAKMNKWVGAVEVDSEGMWILFGQTSTIDSTQHSYEVRMSGDELFYGEGNQIGYGKTDGWQRAYTGDGNSGFYVVPAHHVYNTEKKAQEALIKKVFTIL